MKTFKRCFIGFTLTLSLLLAGPLFLAACAGLQDSGSWRTADRSSAGIAPRPEQEQAEERQRQRAISCVLRDLFASCLTLLTQLLERGRSRHK